MSATLRRQAEEGAARGEVLRSLAAVASSAHQRQLLIKTQLLGERVVCHRVALENWRRLELSVSS